ncbi:hypothetical protein HMPREF3223_00437 [Cutibacterium avidum]|nr:hypothetical protein HMPREF3223_00437 [Cutibacterium avidum]
MSLAAAASPDGYVSSVAPDLPVVCFVASASPTAAWHHVPIRSHFAVALR